MKIKIDEIPQEGLKAHKEYDPQEWDMNTPEISFPDLIRLDAEIKIVSGQLLVKAKVNFLMNLICARCLEEYQILVTKNYFFNYNIKNLTVIDISDDLREEIILDYPRKPLCREDCKGLCPHCGINLNNGKCKCEEVING